MSLATLDDNTIERIRLAFIDAIGSSSFTANIEGDYPEDSAHVSGDRGLFVMGVQNDTGPSSFAASGDYVPLQMSPAGELYVKQDGLSFGAPADGIANPSTAQRVTSFGELWNGTTWDRMPGSTTNGLLVNLGANNDVTVTGSVTSTPVATTLTATTVSIDTEISVTGASTALLAANSSRKRVYIQNHGTGFVRVRLAPTALTTSPIRLVPEVGEYILDSVDGRIYTGVINAISESGTNLVGVIEET